MRWISILGLAFAISSARADFCESRTPEALPATLARVAADPEMRLSFDNEGGLLNGGVCWWHSRFQRAAWYLVRFKDSGSRPSRSVARRLIRAIISRSEVVEIPGYRSLVEFSRDFKKEIQAELEAWQMRDGFVNQAYIRGLWGRSRLLAAAKMKARMDRIYQTYQTLGRRGDVPWLMLQMKGVVSHASLLTEMVPSGDGGYRLAMVDSNYPDQAVEYIYRPGDLELAPANVPARKYTSVPYSGFSRDLSLIRDAITHYCLK